MNLAPTVYAIARNNRKKVMFTKKEWIHAGYFEMAKRAPIDRDVFIMAYADELTPAEIAYVIGSTPRAVEALLENMRRDIEDAAATLHELKQETN